MILITTVSISNSASCQSRGQVRDNPERIRASSPSLRTEISAMARSPPISCIKKMHDEWTAEKPGRGNRPPLQSSELGLSFFFSLAGYFQFWSRTLLLRSRLIEWYCTPYRGFLSAHSFDHHTMSDATGWTLVQCLIIALH